MPQLTASEPIFAVKDVRRAVRFYRDVLGFTGEWSYGGDPPIHGGVTWGAFQLMFSLTPDEADVSSNGHWLRVDDVNALHAQHVAAGAPIVEPIEDKPWGFREYAVRDPDGHRLRFVGSVDYKRPPGATGVLPESVKVEVRTPTVEQWRGLMDSVGWHSHPDAAPQSALDASLFCVVATDARDGQPVGMCRVCGDGRHYTIWDVVVRPELQGRRIGTAILEAAMAELRRTGRKGAFVGLFTGNKSFYERVGFRDGGGMSASV